jgi:hypothetical protein
MKSVKHRHKNNLEVQSPSSKQKVFKCNETRGTTLQLIPVEAPLPDKSRACVCYQSWGP